MNIAYTFNADISIGHCVYFTFIEGKLNSFFEIEIWNNILKVKKILIRNLSSLSWIKPSLQHGVCLNQLESTTMHIPMHLFCRYFNKSNSKRCKIDGRNSVNLIKERKFNVTWRKLWWKKISLYSTWLYLVFEETLNIIKTFICPFLWMLGYVFYFGHKANRSKMLSLHTCISSCHLKFDYIFSKMTNPGCFCLVAAWVRFGHFIFAYGSTRDR